MSDRRQAAHARIVAFSFALLLSGIAFSQTASAQSWSLYDGGSASYGLKPATNSTAEQFFFEMEITTGSGTSSHTSGRLNLLMDTGSTGIVINASKLTDDYDKLTGDPGWAFYNSSGLLVTGKLTQTTVTYVDTVSGKPVTAQVQVLAVPKDGRHCLHYGDNPCSETGEIAMMGVGFGRNTLGTGSPDPNASNVVDTLLNAPTTAQSFNPLVNIVPGDGSAINQGYIIKWAGSSGKIRNDVQVEVGLTSSNTQNFAYGKLASETDPNTGATNWGQAPMAVTVASGSDTVGPQSGILLADTGVTDSFIHVPGQPSGTIANGSTVTVQVLDAGDYVSYSYAVGTDCSSISSGCNPLAPAGVSWVGASATDRGEGYVNTGINFYNGFYYLFDAENGYVGVANSGRGGSNVVVTPVISAIGQIDFDEDFTTTLPVFLRADSAIAAATTATFNNAITGPGGLTLNGTGLVTLSGTNTYSGPTTVQSGSFAVTQSLASAVTVQSGASFDLSGALSVSGATAPLVTVDTGATFTLSGTVDGAVSSAGSTTISTAGTITGDVSNAGTMVNNGTVDGTLTTSGRLSGSGSSGHLVVSEGGTLATGNSIGTMTVGGTYTFGPGAVREVEVASSGAIDLLDVKGTATLNGGTIEVLAEDGLVPVLGDSYVFLTAAGGIAGTHATLNGGLFPDALYPFLTTALAYSNTDAALVVARSGLSFADAASTPNQAAVGAALDQFAPGSALDLSLTHLTQNQYDLAADQLSGQIYASTLTALQNDAGVIRDTIRTRLNAAFDEMDNAPMIASNGTSSARLPGLTASAWISAYGNWGTTDATGNTAKLSTSLAGTLAGVDASIGQVGRVGLAAGYGWSRFKTPDLAASGDAGSTTIAAYGGADFGLLRTSLGATWAWHDLSTDRIVSFPGYSASESTDYSATTGQVFAEGAADLGFAPVDMEAFAGLAFVQTSTDDFSEGSDLTALSGSGDTQSNTLTTLGVRLAKTFPLAGGFVRPHATIGWQHAFGDVDLEATMNFTQSGPSFTVAGAPIARDAAVLGAGVDFKVADRATLSLVYNGRIGSDVSENSASGAFSFTF
ncbi:autotransporter domain-containing protein [Amorphus sp. 3PC139-8]|uniref:autotransporter outer membrane beta-barrel domain-containing protein n=1 Tax=Amorphus sp. 3PC139-8 TaxID=2735676 RepID=UPI00345DE279